MLHGVVACDQKVPGRWRLCASVEQDVPDGLSSKLQRPMAKQSCSTALTMYSYFLCCSVFVWHLSERNAECTAWGGPKRES